MEDLTVNGCACLQNNPCGSHQEKKFSVKWLTEKANTTLSTAYYNRMCQHDWIWSLFSIADGILKNELSYRIPSQLLQLVGKQFFSNPGFKSFKSEFSKWHFQWTLQLVFATANMSNGRFDTVYERAYSRYYLCDSNQVKKMIISLKLLRQKMVKP